MIECYYKWCEHHAKDEPFCGQDCGSDCIATEEDLANFQGLRKLEIANTYNIEMPSSLTKHLLTA